MNGEAHIDRRMLMRWINSIVHGCGYFGQGAHDSTPFVVDAVAGVLAMVVIDTLTNQATDESGRAALRQAVALGLIHGANQRLYDHNVRIESEPITASVH
jgi:hypothetical protein